MGHELFSELLTLLIIAALSLWIFSTLRLPSVLGYLCVGLIAGPHAFALIGHSEVTATLGEIGIAFLLFAIGLEFSIPQFLALRHVLLWLGGAQVVCGTISGTLIALWIGLPLPAAIVVGGALSMSSTAIVVKQLTDQGELQLNHGNLALGILLFQDLAAVPFLVIIPILGGGNEQALTWVLSVALAKAALVFAVMLFLGARLLRPLFQHVAKLNSPELFTLSVLLVSLTAAWLTSAVGLSLALGAFLAGMMLSETEFRHQIDHELRPFKDLLLGVFFITVGMQLDFATLGAQWHWILLLVAGLVIGKGTLIAVLSYIYTRDPIVGVRTGLVLGHGGEFGFALLSLALATQLLSAGDSQAIIAAVVVTMFIAPVLVRYNEIFSFRLLPNKYEKIEGVIDDIAVAAERFSEHVVVCGFGRVGSQIASSLRHDGIPFVGLDQHPAIVKTAWEDGDPVFYGDASNSHLLTAVGLMRARAVVITFNEENHALQTLQHIKALRRDIPVLVRSYDEKDLDRLLAAGASEVFPETFETGLMMTLNLMLALGYSENEVDAAMHRMRSERGNR